MKYTIKYVIIYSLSVLAFCSCASMGKIAIQVAVPPKVTISPEIQSIAILNRSMTRNFINLHDSIPNEKRWSNNDINFKKTFYDSIAADTAIKVAAKAIFDSQRFEVVIPLQMNVLRNDKGGVPDPLDSVSIDKLCNDLKVDGILVLEDFSEKVTRHVHTEYWVFKGVIDVAYKSTWRFYQPRLNPAYQSFVACDTVFWETPGFDDLLSKMYEKLPTIKKALIGGGLALGLALGDRFVPTWEDVNRDYYITGNEKIDAAIPLINKNKWEEAGKIWMKYSSVSSKSLRSKIEYNLALAAEMSNDLNLAIEWGIKSIRTRYSRNAELYLEELGRRRSVIENELEKL